MRFCNRLSFIFVFLFTVIGQANKNQKIVITGSSTVAPLALEIAKRFEKKYKNVRIDVQSGGSSRGITDVQNGISQIGMVSRNLKAKEDHLFAHKIAKDGISLIVHKSNPIQTLTHEQIKKIFLGEISNWSQIGGLHMPITVINKAGGRSTLELFLKHFTLKNSEINAHVIIGDNEQGIKTVAANPSSIGYVSIGTAEVSIKSKSKIKLLPLKGVEATSYNVRMGEFPLSRDLNFITKEKPIGITKKFIEFARSREVKDIVKEMAFIPIK